MTRNRQINTGFNSEKDQRITLEAKIGTRYEGKAVERGETISVSKSEAKRLLTIGKDIFRIHMD